MSAAGNLLYAVALCGTIGVAFAFGHIYARRYAPLIPICALAVSLLTYELAHPIATGMLCATVALFSLAHGLRIANRIRTRGAQFSDGVPLYVPDDGNPDKPCRVAEIPQAAPAASGEIASRVVSAAIADTTADGEQ